MKVCPDCEGRGWNPPDNVDTKDPSSPDNEECNRCKGEGLVND